MAPQLRRVVFRVEHDCPLARLSRQHPRLELHVWSGHRIEFVAVRGILDAAVSADIEHHLKPVRVLPLNDGALVVWRPAVDPKTSLSRRLEEADLLWLQPLRVRAGWEEFDAVAFGPGGEQAALDQLRKDHPTQVVRRDDMDGHEAAALYMSLLPVLEAPTDKQAEALVLAHAQGYYESPRRTTTAELAKLLGIGRSAFEERLRGGENRVMGAVLPAMGRHRTVGTATSIHETG